MRNVRRLVAVALGLVVVIAGPVAAHGAEPPPVRSAETVLEGTGGYAFSSAVGFDPVNGRYLVVSVGDATVAHLVSAEGIVVRRTVLLEDMCSRYHPDVAWSGGHFVVVWTDGCARGSTGALVSAAGDVVVRFAVDVNAAFPAVASVGASALIVYEYTQSVTKTVRARLVGPDGRLGPAFVVSGSAFAAKPTVAAVSGGHYQVAWEQVAATKTEIHGARVDGSGAVLDLVPVRLSPGPGNTSQPHLSAGEGSIGLLTWVDDRNSTESGNDIYAARVSTGRALDHVAIPVAVRPGAQELPNVVWTGKVFQVVWRDRGIYRVLGARVAPDGHVVDAASFAVSDRWSPRRPQQAAGAGATAVTYATDSSVLRLLG